MHGRYWVYIVTDKPFGTIYVGFTGDIFRRSFEHREGLYKGFAKKYGLKMLVYAEECSEVHDAIAREKQLKKWKRAWKIDLIKKLNPDWRDLYESLNG